MTDVHLCKDSQCKEVLDHPSYTDPVEFFNDVIDDINSLEIDISFVIDTGDMIAEGNRANLSRAEEWYDLYDDAISNLSVPVHHVLGNHDIVGIYNRDVNKSDPRYGEGVYQAYYGPTYYSFDYGPCHFVVLDPHRISGRHMLIEVPDDQIEWLRRDLAIQNEDKRVLVFFHEPTLEWKKSDAIEVLDLLKQHEAEEIFCGHFHFNKLFYARGIPEQVTGAVCGNWWYDNLCLDGCPSGYRVVIVDTYISTFYKGMGGEKWE